MRSIAIIGTLTLILVGCGHGDGDDDGANHGNEHGDMARHESPDLAMACFEPNILCGGHCVNPNEDRLTAARAAMSVPRRSAATWASASRPVPWARPRATACA